MLQINGCVLKSNALTSYQRVCSVMFKCAGTVQVITDTPAINIVTFDFKSTRVRCFISGSTDYQMNVS